MEQAGFQGHSLGVTAATRLFYAQLMSRTGHSSTDGVRAYKRTSTNLKQWNVLNSGKIEDVCKLGIGFSRA